MPRKVYNLSITTLSWYQVSILLRGLKLTSTPTTNNMHLKSDTQTFCRKLSLAEYCDNASENAFAKDISSQPLVKNESKFYPPKNRNKELDQHIDSLKDLHVRNISKPFKNNFNKIEWVELNQLKNDPDMVIKKLTREVQ